MKGDVLMALIRPVLLSIPAFDATQEYSFVFTVAEGGTQITGNNLVIKDNVTNTVVYNQTQNTFKYEHTLPANTLENGKNYNVTVATIDAQGNKSADSVPVQFWCYTQPSIVISNMPSGNVINTASFEFSFTYTQPENERLNLYEFNLYNTSNQIISTSGVLYAVNGTSPFDGSYLFSGFANATAYKIEVTGVTINNTVVTTGLIDFAVRYSAPNVYSLIFLENNCENGYISLQSNLVSIEGKSQPDPPVYINNEEVDLTASNSYVTWDEGFNLNGDILTRIWFRNPTPNSNLIQYSNINGDIITVKYNEGYIDDDDTTEKKAYISLTVDNGIGSHYYIYSDYISILEYFEHYNLWIRKIDNIYQLEFDRL